MVVLVNIFCLEILHVTNMSDDNYTLDLVSVFKTHIRRKGQCVCFAPLTMRHLVFACSVSNIHPSVSS